MKNEEWNKICCLTMTNGDENNISIPQEWGIHIFLLMGWGGIKVIHFHYQSKTFYYSFISTK